MSLNSYEVAADGSDFDEVWVNQMAIAAGRIPNVSINPRKAYDYLVWRSGAVYYAQNGATGVVTSNAALHTLVNGILDDNVSIKFDDATYVLTGAIEFSDYSAASIYGTPKIGSVFQPVDTINAFEFDENWNCVLQDLKIDGQNQTTSGMGLQFTQATGTNYAFRNMIRNIEFHSCYIGIGDLNNGANGSAANLFQDITMFESTFTDVRLNVNGTGFWRFNRCTFDHIGGVAADAYSFRMTGADGFVMDTCSWLMGGATSEGGAHIEDTDFIWMSNCDLEKSGLSGFVFKDCRYGLFNNLRMHESALDGGATGEANLALPGCRDFSFTNTSLNIATGATNHLLHILADGGTESDHITFNGGHISNGAGKGVVLSDASTNIKLLGMNIYSNTDVDVFEEDTTNYNTYFNNNMNSGNGWTLIGPRNTYDVHLMSEELDLSGAAVNPEIFFSATDCALVGYRIIYTEAASADAGVDVRIGRYRTGVALDDDYFDETTSVPNSGLGDEDFFNAAALTNQAIASGDIVTVGTAGGKAGIGNVKLILSIMENAS